MYFKTCPQNPVMFFECYHQQPQEREGDGQREHWKREEQTQKLSSFLPALRGKKKIKRRKLVATRKENLLNNELNLEGFFFFLSIGLTSHKMKKPQSSAVQHCAHG